MRVQGSIAKMKEGSSMVGIGPCSYVHRHHR